MRRERERRAGGAGGGEVRALFACKERSLTVFLPCDPQHF